MVFWIFLVKEALSPLFMSKFSEGNTAVAKATPNILTATLWIFLAKLKAANPPSTILIPTTANMYKFICQKNKLIDFGIINLTIFLKPGWRIFSSGLYLYSV